MCKRCKLRWGQGCRPARRGASPPAPRQPGSHSALLARLIVPAPVAPPGCAGAATRLESQFRLTYSMILNLLRVEDLKVRPSCQPPLCCLPAACTHECALQGAASATHGRQMACSLPALPLPSRWRTCSSARLQSSMPSGRSQSCCRWGRDRADATDSQVLCGRRPSADTCSQAAAVQLPGGCVPS